MKRTHSISRLALLLGFCLPGAIVVGQWSASEAWNGTGTPCYDYVWTATKSEKVPNNSTSCSFFTVCPTAIECQANRSSGYASMREKPPGEPNIITLRCREKREGTYNRDTGLCEGGLWRDDVISLKEKSLPITKICDGEKCPPETPNYNEP
jgi:hypothetical protein